MACDAGQPVLATPAPLAKTNLTSPDPNDLLRRELAEHDGLELAALSGALQLLPQNAHHADRLVALATAGLAETGTAAVTDERLRHWLHAAPSLHRGPAWDPYEGPFAEPVTFIGGGYVLPTGGAPEAIFDLQLLLETLIGRRQPLERNQLNRSLMGLAIGGLAVGNHACRVAGVDRWASAEQADQVQVPDRAELSQLQAAVSFDRTELEELLNVDLASLGPIIWDIDAQGPPQQVERDVQFGRQPLLRFGDRFILVEPGALAPALRHGMVLLALDAGLRDELVELLAKSAIQSAWQAADRMNWDQRHLFYAPDGPLASLVSAFDTDKAVAVTLVYEDFEGYTADDPWSPWDLFRWEEALQRHLRRIENELMFAEGRPPNELLHLVVTAGCGRSSHLGLSEPPAPLRAPRIILSLENLQRISMAGTDRLLLWKYAQASDRLREYARAFGFDPLDEFAAWFEDQSFYFGDDGRPTAVMFDSSHGRAFREQVAAATDVHSVLSPRRSWLEVVRLHEEGTIPIYAPLRELGGRPILLVEGAAKPIWIQAPAEIDPPEHRAPYAEMVDSVAYWIWQVTPSLPAIETAVNERLLIDVELEHPELWASYSVPEGAGDSVTAAVRNGTVVVRIHDGLLKELDSADNRGERDLVRALLSGIDELVDPVDRLGSQGMAQALERHAPLGHKKKINLLSAEVEPSLRTGDLPPYRRVSPAEIDLLLDEAGQHLATEHHLTPGPIPADRRVPVLNAVVAFHFSQLEREVAVLSPEGLLEFLVERNEKVLQTEALRRRTMGSRMAAFGETGLIEQMREMLPLDTQTSVSLRFLIEYVTARQPRGLRPLSLDLYDRLLAICGQIITRGTTSDVIRFGIEETELSFLRSRRLGLLGSGDYHRGQKTYLDAMVPAYARHLGARYAESWDEREPQVKMDLSEVEAAARAEWGFTLTELLEFFHALGDAAGARTDSSASCPCDELETELASTLEWPLKRVREAASLVTLRPRAVFQDPPPGFKRFELWPWRYNRELSYLRRPLLRRPGPSGEEYVWGVRQSVESARFLTVLIETDRLRAESDVMKNLMTRLRQAETHEFVEGVAALCRQHGMAAVVNVKKVDGERITRANGEDLTDVDVLAAHPATKVIYALECKDLEGARTPAELSNELANTFRAGGSKRSAADKQNERVGWLAARIPATLRHLGLPESATGWKIEGAIVTDVHVISPHVTECPLPVYARSELAERFERLEDIVRADNDK